MPLQNHRDSERLPGYGFYSSGCGNFFSSDECNSSIDCRSSFDKVGAAIFVCLVFVSDSINLSDFG